MVKTAIIGASGYVGRHLWAAYNKTFPGALGTAFSSHNATLVPFDIRQPNIASLSLEEQRYEAVIIAAAIADVAFCEHNSESAYAVNVQGTLELVRQLAKTSLQTIILSTDYVFEGFSGNYEDKAPTLPATQYGKQKAILEHAIPLLTDNFLILRIGKVYGIEKGDKTFIDEMASSLACGQTVRCASDQFFCPVWIHDLVTAILHIQSKKCTGTLNLCSAEICSRYKIASSLAEEMRVDKNLIEEIALYEIPSMIGRPLNTTMKCSSAVVRGLQSKFKPLAQAVKLIANNYRSADLIGESK